MNASTLSPGYLATLACVLEVSAPKPGNVHRGADFEDVTLNDFLVSAVALGQTISRCQGRGIGETILQAVALNRDMVGTNTNLGIVLLLVPIIKTIEQLPSGATLTASNVAATLQGLLPADGQLVFDAIRIASPGGLDQSDELDVTQTTGKVDLIQAMNLAADRDLIARQYSNGFSQVFDDAVSLLVDGVKRFGDIPNGIVYGHVALMAKHPDSLICRKCGESAAIQSQVMAQKAMDAIALQGDGWGDSTAFWDRVSELDFWLRSDGHRRNPGTTADLVAAGLLVALYNKQIVMSA